MKAARFKFQKSFRHEYYNQRAVRLFFSQALCLARLLSKGNNGAPDRSFTASSNEILKLTNRPSTSQNQAIKELFCRLTMLYIDI